AGDPRAAAGSRARARRARAPTPPTRHPRREAPAAPGIRRTAGRDVRAVPPRRQPTPSVGVFDAEPGGGHHLEARLTDRVAAHLAASVLALVELAQRELDVVELIAQPRRQRL